MKEAFTEMFAQEIAAGAVEAMVSANWATSDTPRWMTWRSGRVPCHLADFATESTRRIRQAMGYRE